MPAVRCRGTASVHARATGEGRRHEDVRMPAFERVRPDLRARSCVGEREYRSRRATRRRALAVMPIRLQVCVHEHAAHRAVANAWFRTRSRPMPWTQSNSAQVTRPSTRTHRPAVWLPSGGVGGDRPRRPARAGRNHGCNPLPHEPKRRETLASQRPGAFTTRPPWPVDPEPAPPAGSHTATPLRAKGAAPRRLVCRAGARELGAREPGS